MKQVIYLHAPGKSKTNHDIGAMRHWSSDDGAGDDHLDAGPGNDSCVAVVGSAPTGSSASSFDHA